MQTRSRANRGVVILAALLVVAGELLLMMVGLTRAMTDVLSARLMVGKQQAFVLAETGVDDAVTQLADGYDALDVCTNNQWKPFGQGSYRCTINGPLASNTYAIHAEGQVGTTIRVIDATASLQLQSAYASAIHAEQRLYLKDAMFMDLYDARDGACDSWSPCPTTSALRGRISIGSANANALVLDDQNPLPPNILGWSAIPKAASGGDMVLGVNLQLPATTTPVSQIVSSPGYQADVWASTTNQPAPFAPAAPLAGQIDRRDDSYKPQSLNCPGLVTDLIVKAGETKTLKPIANKSFTPQAGPQIPVCYNRVIVEENGTLLIPPTTALKIQVLQELRVEAGGQINPAATGLASLPIPQGSSSSGGGNKTAGGVGGATPAPLVCASFCAAEPDRLEFVTAKDVPIELNGTNDNPVYVSAYFYALEAKGFVAKSAALWGAVVTSSAYFENSVLHHDTSQLVANPRVTSGVSGVELLSWQESL